MGTTTEKITHEVIQEKQDQLDRLAHEGPAEPVGQTDTVTEDLEDLRDKKDKLQQQGLRGLPQPDEPCPCGSGRTFGDCCQTLEPPPDV